MYGVALCGSYGGQGSGVTIINGVMHKSFGFLSQNAMQVGRFTRP